jgi:hypothetical protein
MPQSYAGTQNQQMARGEKGKFYKFAGDVRFKVGYLQTDNSFLTHWQGNNRRWRR